MPCLMESTSPQSNDRLAGEPYTSEETIVHSGIIEIASVKGSPKVFVVIHCTSTEHFVVFYPLRLIASARKPISTINLRSSLVTCTESGLVTIRPRKDIDGASITLRVNPVTNENINKWMLALTGSHRYTCNNNNQKTLTTSMSDGNSIINKKDDTFINHQQSNNKHLNQPPTNGYRQRYMPGAMSCNPVRFGSYHLPPLVESIED